MIKADIRKNIYLALAVIAVMTGLSACSSFTDYRYWNIYTMTEPAGSHDKSFKDEKISIRFWLNEKKIFFKMKNLAATPVTINWEQAAFINVDGKKYSVANGNSIFTSRQKSPPPTVLEPGEEIIDFVSPIKNVEKLEEWTWYIYPLFNLVDDKALKNKGQKIGVDLPMQYGEKSVTYAFRFKVANVVPYLEHSN